MPARALYVGQTVELICNNGLTTGFFPVISAECELNRPVESANGFGRANSLAMQQVDLTTCKSSLKVYLSKEIGVGRNSLGNIVSFTGLSATGLTMLKNDALAGRQTVLNVYPNGFRASGILSNIGIDLSYGGFATADLSFNGVGRPIFNTAPATSNFSESSLMPKSIQPITSFYASGSITSGCSNSFKFAMDMPTENLFCLGDQIDEAQGLSQSAIVVSKPPYKSSISVEGLGVNVSPSPQLNAIITGTYILGDLGIRLPNPQITQRSYNNAIGNVGASYNYTIESADVTWQAYNPFGLTAVPLYDVYDANSVEILTQFGVGNYNQYSQLVLEFSPEALYPSFQGFLDITAYKHVGSYTFLKSVLAGVGYGDGIYYFRIACYGAYPYQSGPVYSDEFEYVLAT